jgi:glycosyltransferase involved in cell wall biosynthesis
MRLALSNPDEAEHWAENAYELVTVEYSWDGVAEQTDNIYNQLVE